MKANVLDANPRNCAEGVLLASKHLGGPRGQVMGSTTTYPTISDRFTEQTVELGKKATPKDCAECIGRQLCRVYDGAPEGEASPLNVTHTAMLRSREGLSTQHNKLASKSERIEDQKQIQQAQQIRTREAQDEVSRGVDPKLLEELGLPVLEGVDLPIAS